MKHKLILKLTATLTSFFIILPCMASAEGGVMFSSKALKEWGITSFEAGDPELDIIDRKTEKNVGKIEGGRFIDTEPEAAIALWLESPQQIETLPRNELGVKRLCFDLYVRMAEYPEKKKNYLSAINLVLKMAKEKHGVSVKLSEARKFYEEAIKEKIYATPLGEPLTVEEQKKVKELLLAYMIEPTKKNAIKNRDYRYKIALENEEYEKAGIVIAFAGKISDQIALKFA